MIDLDNGVVQFKTALLDRVLPTWRVIVYGDMYVVEGGYAHYVATHGAEMATLVDTTETRAWQQTRLHVDNLDFLKGDFANERFMATLPGPFTSGVAFDVLLHQPALIHALHLMLERVSTHFVFAHPTLEEQAGSQSLIFLPGNTDRGLYPLAAQDHEHNVFSVDLVNQSQWIWGITASFLRSALQAEGFEVVHEQTLGPLSNPRWSMWGGIAERRRKLDSRHWSQMVANPLFHPGWEADGAV